MRCTLPGLVILDTNILFDTFRIFRYTAFDSFRLAVWSLNSSLFFFSLNSRVIPPLQKFWPVFKKFGVSLESYNFVKFSMVLEEKIENFSNFAVLEVVVDGRRKGKLWVLVLAAGVQNGRSFVLFKAMTKYGKPSAKEHQIWWSVKKRQKFELKRAGCAVREAIKLNLRKQGVTNRKASLFLSEAWQRNFEPILKFQNVQFQLCYRSPTTIPSNGKLLLLLLLRHC